jgi:diguanylate cyclase (GGDEF)-like protein
LQRLRRPGSIWRAADGPVIDPETGLFGRQALTEVLAWHGQREDSAPMAVTVAQVDALTSYRHLYGADGARAMLNKVAAALGNGTARLGDALMAFDAGSFALVAAPLRTDAYRRAESLRQSVISLRLAHCESAFRDCVSISIGVAPGRRGGPETVAQLLPNAIRAAEQAAAEGGNRTICVDEII